jgi:tRNA (guanine37-N1)-methyltransferase
MRIDLLSIFPEVFEPVLGASITGRARAAGRVAWHAHDIRDYTIDKHSRVDDRPFGGGPGMVMACQPVWDAVRAVEAMDDRPAARVYMTPQGERLTQPIVEELAEAPRLLILAGHYEGIDERVIERLAPREVSVGDYVLSGGEIPAMLLVDAVVRLLPGVLGHEESAAQDSFSAPAGSAESGEARRLLDCPHYTRPRVWEGMEAPEVLFSGDHGAVERWRRERAIERTRERRPDLLEGPRAD